MKRNESLITLGCIWTLYFTLSVATPGTLSLLSVGLLGAGIMLSGLLWLGCGLNGGRYLVGLANLTHLSVAGLWLAWVSSEQHLAFTAIHGVFVALSLSLGITLANLGAVPAQIEVSLQSPKTDELNLTKGFDAATFSSAPLAAYESGGFRAIPRPAYESGGFRIP